jgi:Trp operon repressor
MVTDASTPEIPGDSPNLYEIEAVVVGVRPDSDLNAVELEVLDLGAGFKTWLGPDAVLDLLSRLLSALTELLGRDEHARCIEAKRLIEALARVGVDQKHIARRLGVSDTMVSVWKRGRPSPSIERLSQLRHLARGALRED